MYEIQFQLTILYLLCLGFALTSSTYPTIIWDPMNPFFACHNTKMNAKIGDTVNIQCPTKEFNFFMPNITNVFPIYENLYFLNKNREQYNACNATGMTPLLNCSDGKNNIFTIIFRDIQTAEDALLFKRGETYYFIGTGFRTKDNLKNVVNGSCCQKDAVGKYYLKFEIYICKNNDIECNVCKSPGCYYKSCHWRCHPWRNMTYNDKGCRILQTRKCMNDILGETKQETKFTGVPCPTLRIPETSGTPTMPSATSGSIRTTTTRRTTTKPTIPSATSGSIRTTTTRRRTTIKPTPTTTVSKKTETHYDRITDDTNSNISLLTGFLAGVICFIIGLVLGIFVHKHNYIKQRCCVKTGSAQNIHPFDMNNYMKGNAST